MSSIKPVLNYRPDKEGRYTLLFQVLHKRKRGTIFTSYRLLPKQFDKQKGKVLTVGKSRTEHEQVRLINNYITSQIKELNAIVDELDNRKTPFTPKDVTEIYHQRYDRRYLRTYIENLCDILEQQGRHGTARNYRSTLIAIEKYTGNERCRFEDLNTAFLADFENNLRQYGQRRNTTTFYLRVLRAIYNKARRDHIVDSHENPFISISFREDKTRKLAINETALRKIAKAENIPTHLSLSRDLFLFSFYARGMSFVDMAYLRQDQISNEMLRYNRRKTGQPFLIRITSPMKEIIKRYEYSAPWVFPLMCNIDGLVTKAQQGQSETEFKQLLHRCYANSLSRQTRNLEKISDYLTLESKLSFNVARHSWASLARSRGIPLSIISGGLGHTSEKTTNIYLDELDNDKLDQANEIVTML